MWRAVLPTLGVSLLGVSLCWTQAERFHGHRVLCDSGSLATKSISEERRDNLRSFREMLTGELEYFKTVNNIPGMSCIVGVDGKIVYSYGSGYSDVETLSHCLDYSLHRIASISKMITAIIVAKLVEKEMLNFDDKVSKFFTGLPKKIGDITIENLVSNTSGVRHYRNNKENPENRHFALLEQSFDLFLNDELIHFPGQSFTYSTHGFTLLGAVIENATGVKFEKHLSEFCREIGLINTYVDHVTRLNFQKTNGYYINKEGKLEKFQYMDNSWKYPGGGCLSNGYDLLKIGNMLLLSYENSKSYLKSDTVNKLWTPTEQSLNHFKDRSGYGLGFRVSYIEEHQPLYEYGDLTVFHAGTGEGSSGILLIVPPRDRNPTKTQKLLNSHDPSPKSPKGIVVIILCNLHGVKFRKLANTIIQHTYSSYEEFLR